MFEMSKVEIEHWKVVLLNLAY